MIQHLANTYLAARRKRWFCSKPVVDDRMLVTAADLVALQARIDCTLPADMREWLTTVGFCTFNEELNFQANWFRRFGKGDLADAIIFAQDELGSHYGFLPSNGRVIYFARFEPYYAVLAESFQGFLQELQARNYRVVEWIDSISLLPYNLDK